MLLLTSQQRRQWADLATRVLEGQVVPRDLDGEISANVRPAFHYFAGALLASRQQEHRALEWFSSGARLEDQTLMSNAFAASFLKRQGGRFVMPDVAFADPAPYVHFTTVPAIRSARASFIRQCGESLPGCTGPFRVVDIGCGDGSLLVELLCHLLETNRIREIGEILLVDASPAMIALARKTVAARFPPSVIKTVTGKIQDVASSLDGHFDLAVMSLCYHHMPREAKVRHLRELKSKADCFVLFELDGNHDLPERDSPELVFSVYQTYGRLIDAAFAHDAPVELANACVDRFLMVEAVSILTQPRGVRTDYHMLRPQWHEVFTDALGSSFECLGDFTAYSDDFLTLFTLTYGQ
jgi:SAM-dependent methyltransferase